MRPTYQHTRPDKDQFYQLFESTGWNENYKLTPEEIYDALEAAWHSISAYDGKRLVGFGRILSDGKLHALITEMIVLPEYQGRGIGRVIMNDLLEKCRQHEIRDVQLFCAQGKVGFYQKFGFVKRRDDAPGMGIFYSSPDQG
jgi:GNAT superfamily N-acetyltransferase